MGQLNKKGFSLLELLLVIGIIGLISGFAVSISSSLKGMSKVTETKNRMSVIQDAMVDYYSGHDALPADGTTPADSVPVDATSLNLEQKYRLDAWGQYLRYDPGTESDIDDIVVDGNSVAGVIVSGGPDQTIEPGNTSTPYTTSGDDILIPVNVHSQAVEIALEELQELQNYVSYFDALYAGVDNDSNSIVDDDNCIPNTDTTSCPPTIDNDPNCGRATLDVMIPGTGFTCASYTNYNASTTAVNFVIDKYGLDFTKYGQDPWGNPYNWDIARDSFYSLGPDGSDSTNDEIYP